MHGRDPSIEGAILLSPPLHRATDADLDAWAAFGKPLVVLVPELDDYLRPDEARARFARVPQAEVIGVDGAKHLWVGESAVRRVLDEIVGHVAARPPGARCPTHLVRPEHDRGGRRMSLHTYREDGDGLPLVLLHGVPARPPHVGRRSRPLPAGRPVHAVDLPGTPGRRGPTCRSRRSRRPPTASRRALRARGRRARRRRRPVDGRLRRARARSSATPTSSRRSRSSTPSRRPTPPRRAPTGCASRTRRRRPARSTPSGPWRRRCWARRRGPSRPEVADEVDGVDRASRSPPGSPGRSARWPPARTAPTCCGRSTGPVVVRRRRRGHRHAGRGRRAPGRDGAARAAVVVPRAGHLSADRAARRRRRGPRRPGPGAPTPDASEPTG